MSLLLMGAGKATDAGAPAYDPRTLTGLTMAGWYENDASKVYKDLGVNLAANTDHIQQINDKSGLNNHINDNGNGSGLFPTWNTTLGTAGRITFDGDDTLLSGTKAWTDGNGSLTVSWAGRVADVSGTQFLLSLSGSSNVLRLFINAGVPTVRSYGTTGVSFDATSGTVSSATDFDVTAIVDGVNKTLKILTNGVAGSTVDMSSDTNPRQSANTELYLASLTGAFRLIAGSNMASARLWRGVMQSSDLAPSRTDIRTRL